MGNKKLEAYEKFQAATSAWNPCNEIPEPKDFGLTNQEAFAFKHPFVWMLRGKVAGFIHFSGAEDAMLTFGGMIYQMGIGEIASAEKFQLSEAAQMGSNA